ncbi:MAG: hypothetical protein RJA24_1288, partial [Pseudomonadota bacterium]
MNGFLLVLLAGNAVALPQQNSGQPIFTAILPTIAL